MTKKEMNKVWQLIGTYRKGDQRLSDQQLLRAWYMALAPYRFEDVENAVTAYFRKNNFWPNVSEIVKELPLVSEAERRRYAPPTPSEGRSMEKLLEWQAQWHKELKEMGLPTLKEALADGMAPGEWSRMLVAAGVFGVDRKEAGHMAAQREEGQK